MDDKLVDAEQLDESNADGAFDITEEQVAVMMELTGKTEPQAAIEHFVTVLLKNFIAPERVVSALLSDFQAFARSQGRPQ